MSWRFRAGLLVGFAAGYYFGTRAGRERYEELNRMLRSAAQSDRAQAAAGKARDVLETGVGRARELVDARRGAAPEARRYPFLGAPSA